MKGFDSDVKTDPDQDTFQEDSSDEEDLSEGEDESSLDIKYDLDVKAVKGTLDVKYCVCSNQLIIYIVCVFIKLR